MLCQVTSHETKEGDLRQGKRQLQLEIVDCEMTNAKRVGDV